MRNAKFRLTHLAFFRVYSDNELNIIKFNLASNRNIQIADDDNMFDVIQLYNMSEKRSEEEAKLLVKQRGKRNG